MSAFSRAVASRSEGENMKGHDKRLDSYIQQVRPRFERMLAEMVEQPSISMDPTHAPDIRRAALLAVGAKSASAPGAVTAPSRN